MSTVDGVEYCDECDYFVGVYGCAVGICRKPKGAKKQRRKQRRASSTPTKDNHHGR